MTTSAASSLATTSATLNGNLGSLGTAASVSVSFEWGTTTSYGSETTAQSMTAIGAFTANLTGLTARTTYHFRAKAVGDGPAVYGDDMTFTTASPADTTAPTISLVTSSGITTTSATITWSTSEAATTQVKYGLTEEYDSVTTEVTSLVTGHSVDLTGLKAGKTYHYQVISKDAANNQAVSDRCNLHHGLAFRRNASLGLGDHCACGGRSLGRCGLLCVHEDGQAEVDTDTQISERGGQRCPPCFRPSRMRHPQQVSNPLGGKPSIAP